MIHLHVIAEGHSEEDFIRDVLTPHLAGFNVFVACQMVHTGGNKTHPIKGGLGKIPKYKPIRRALERWVEADRDRTDVWYTTMLDLYAFPKDDESPYTEDIRAITDKYQRVTKLEADMFALHKVPRFIPYVQLHEFETFLLVDVERLGPMEPKSKTALRRLADQMIGLNVELVNDSPQTAPSKRIINAMPAYEVQKRTLGPMVAEEIGIPALRTACDHFNEWLTRLEQLGTV